MSNGEREPVCTVAGGGFSSISSGSCASSPAAAHDIRRFAGVAGAGGAGGGTGAATGAAADQWCRADLPPPRRARGDPAAAGAWVERAVALLGRSVRRPSSAEGHWAESVVSCVISW